MGSPSASVTLREINADTVRAICALRVAPAQECLVAPNAVSIAQAYFEPAAWFGASTPGRAGRLRDALRLDPG